mmetsp:Transcript_22110/g.65569  ORF Transcript_22110/g.65569 Transcript_22110/m.65569 type:complete len:254 (-) Transcript_22110:966-1727(-)
MLPLSPFGAYTIHLVPQHAGDFISVLQPRPVEYPVGDSFVVGHDHILVERIPQRKMILHPDQRCLRTDLSPFDRPVFGMIYLSTISAVADDRPRFVVTNTVIIALRHVLVAYLPVRRVAPQKGEVYTSIPPCHNIVHHIPRPVLVVSLRQEQFRLRKLGQSSMYIGIGDIPHIQPTPLQPTYHVVIPTRTGRYRIFVNGLDIDQVLTRAIPECRLVIFGTRVRPVIGNFDRSTIEGFATPIVVRLIGVGGELH